MVATHKPIKVTAESDLIRLLDQAANEPVLVEKDGVVTAIWEMQGRKHLRTIDPRSRQGQDILRLYTTEHHEEPSAAGASEAISS